MTVKVTDHGFIEPMKSIRFNISMEQLVDLQLMDIQFSEIILNQTRTPNLQELFLHNVPEDCQMEILLPYYHVQALTYRFPYLGKPQKNKKKLFVFSGPATKTFSPSSLVATFFGELF